MNIQSFDNVTIRPAELKDCNICAELSKIKELRPAGGSYILNIFNLGKLDNKS